MVSAAVVSVTCDTTCARLPDSRKSYPGFFRKNLSRRKSEIVHAHNRKLDSNARESLILQG
jgi:hypothetical protein